MAKAKAVGGGIGAFFNNPGTIILGALAIGFLFFKDDIVKAFGSIGDSLGEGFGNIDISLPEINLPDISFPDITFPEITFPEITFPDFPNPFEGFDLTNLFGGGNGPDLPPDVENTGLLTPGQRDQCQCGTQIIQDIQGDVSETCQECPPGQEVEIPGDIGGSEFASARNELEFRARQDPIRDIIQTVQTGITGQTFGGGGPSFIGGSVTEIPLERLSLGQIIERFDVSASRAASLRAEAIGFTQEEQAFLNQGQEISPLGDFSSSPQVSNIEFEGLTPEEIALRLTGGNISNF